MDQTGRILELLLVYVMLPIWMVAGFADAICHKVQRIEHSAGLKESWLHLAMMAELGTGIVAALSLQPTATLLILLLLVCIAHEATAWWDLAYASARRVIPPFEQWVHAVQMASPWACWVALAVAHHEVLVLDSSHWDWILRWRDPPLPASGWAAVALGSLGLVVIPLLIEHRRCASAVKGFA